MPTIICNRFEYCFLHEVHCVTPASVNLKSGYHLRELSSRSVEYTKTNKETDAGPVITETVKLKISHDTILTQLNDAKLIVILHSSDNKRIIVGLFDNPVTYSYQQKPPETEFTFTVKH